MELGSDNDDVQDTIVIKPEKPESVNGREEEDHEKLDQIEVSAATAVYSDSGTLEIKDQQDPSKVKLLENILSLWLKNALATTTPTDAEILKQAQDFATSLSMSFSCSTKWIQAVKRSVHEEMNLEKKSADKHEESENKTTLRRSTRKRKAKVFADSVVEELPSRKAKIGEDTVDEKQSLSVVLCKVEDVGDCNEETVNQRQNDTEALNMDVIDEGISQMLDYSSESMVDDDICPITGLRIYGDEQATAYMTPKRQKRVLHALTQLEKKALCLFVKQNPKCTRYNMMDYCKKYFNKPISKTTAGDIRRDMDKWINMKNPSKISSRSKGGCNYPELERILAEWVRSVYKNFGYIPEKVIVDKAKKIGAALGIKSFSYSVGWVSTFKSRHGLQKYNFLKGKESGEETFTENEDNKEHNESEISMEEMDNSEVNIKEMENSTSNEMGSHDNQETNKSTLSVPADKEVNNTEEKKENNTEEKKDADNEVEENPQEKNNQKDNSKSDEDSEPECVPTKRKPRSAKKKRGRRSVVTSEYNYPAEYQVPEECLDEEYEDTKGWLTLKQKREICQFHVNYPDVPPKEIRQIFSYRFKKRIAKTTLSGIIKDSNKWISIDPKLGKFKQKGKYPLLDKALSNWINKGIERGFTFTNKLIYEQARVFGQKLGIHGPDWNYSDYWLIGFKRRYGFENLCNPPKKMKEEKESTVKGDEEIQDVNPTEDLNKSDDDKESSKTPEKITNKEEKDSSEIDDKLRSLSAFDPNEISAADTKRSMVFLNPYEKHQLCLYYKANPSATSSQLQAFAKQQFDKLVGKSTVNDLKKCADIWANLENPEEQVNRIKKGKYPLLEEILAKWMNEELLSGEQPSVKRIIEKGKELAPNVGIGPDDFKFKEDWVVRFKQRFGFYHPEPERRRKSGKQHIQEVVVELEEVNNPELFNKLISDMEKAEQQMEEAATEEEIREHEECFDTLDENERYWHFKMKEKVN